jgi:hypothetical protein
MADRPGIRPDRSAGHDDRAPYHTDRFSPGAFFIHKSANSTTFGTYSKRRLMVQMENPAQSGIFIEILKSSINFSKETIDIYNYLL